MPPSQQKQKAMVDVHDVDCGSGPGGLQYLGHSPDQAQTQIDVCLDSNSICLATCAFEMLRFLPLETKERIAVFVTAANLNNEVTGSRGGPQDDPVRGPVDTARPVGTYYFQIPEVVQMELEWDLYKRSMGRWTISLAQ